MNITAIDTNIAIYAFGSKLSEASHIHKMVQDSRDLMNSGATFALPSLVQFEIGLSKNDPQAILQHLMACQLMPLQATLPVMQRGAELHRLAFGPQTSCPYCSGLKSKKDHRFDALILATCEKNRVGRLATFDGNMAEDFQKHTSVEIFQPKMLQPHLIEADRVDLGDLGQGGSRR